GIRFESRTGVTDANGNFWLFGGVTSSGNQDLFNDLWVYCPGTNKWTWASGNNFINPTGNWGSLGISSPLNIPSGRGGSAMWYDNSGHLYVFGGNGGWPNLYNDLW